MKIDKALKLMARKKSRVALHHKRLESKNILRQGCQISLGYYTNTKGNPKVQFPTKVAPKEEKHQMLETKKVALYHRGKSCLWRGWYVRLWHCDTKANHVSTAGRMFENCLEMQRQIMLLP
jgi:hypothetical protein